jgi:hypothetical protein
MMEETHSSETSVYTRLNNFTIRNTAILTDGEVCIVIRHRVRQRDVITEEWISSQILQKLS